MRDTFERPEREPNSRNDAPNLPRVTQKPPDDHVPPLFISGMGVSGHIVPDIATGLAPVTRPDN